MFVRVSVCLSSAHISQKPHAQISLNFLYTLPVGVARSSPDGNASGCIMEQMNQNQRRCALNFNTFFGIRKLGVSGLSCGVIIGLAVLINVFPVVLSLFTRDHCCYF